MHWLLPTLCAGDLAAHLLCQIMELVEAAQKNDENFTALGSQAQDLMDVVIEHAETLQSSSSCRNIMWSFTDLLEVMCRATVQQGMATVHHCCCQPALLVQQDCAGLVWPLSGPFNEASVSSTCTNAC